MATNPYFNFFNNTAEQGLLESLIIESIKIYGHDLYYLPRNLYNVNEILNEPEFYDFSSAHEVEMYVKNIDSFEGDGNLLSKFGLEVRDQITLTVAIKTFSNLNIPDIQRPREGDCIYVPMLDALYQIKYVENASVYYQLGTLNMYDCICELFEYNNEKFNTGIPEIDDKYNAYQTEVHQFAYLLENGDALADEYGNVIVTEDFDRDPMDVFDDSDFIEEEGEKIIDWSEQNPFSEGEIF